MRDPEKAPADVGECRRCTVRAVVGILCGLGADWHDHPMEVEPTR